MLHNNRIWCLNEVESAEDLATKLTTTTWCCCQAFRIKGHDNYLWLNDSTSEDGAQEFAVLKRDASTEALTQIESVTFGWCETAQALRFILATLNGEDDHHDWAISVNPMIQSPKDHGRCSHCA
ncbi:MAG: hypothetical protein KDA89_06590 [Planctomycetaceae bacterium]|nr:hypothetical protein [Planctomycetaceae bacterium]